MVTSAYRSINLCLLTQFKACVYLETLQSFVQSFGILIQIINSFFPYLCLLRFYEYDLIHTVSCSDWC